MGEAAGSFVVVRTGSRRVAFPEGNVKAIKTWAEPIFLPRSLEWLQGLRVEDGQAVPVLRGGILGGEETAPEVMLLLEARGRVLAVPAREPRLLRGEVTGGQEIPPASFWSGELQAGGETIRGVNVEKLYTELGLHYN